MVVTTASAADFQPAPLLSPNGQAVQLNQNANSSMAFDSTGTLHLTFWTGGFATTPSTPSAIWYSSWKASTGWSVPVEVDNSFYNPGTGDVKYGGRQPSLAIAPDDTVWIVWHDHRHSNPNSPGNGIDNIEIYADRKPVGGSFSATDIRLTNTSSGNGGDNGYLPRIVAAESGIVSVLWYDFSADGTISDIYAKHSSPLGVFNLSEPISSLRATNFNLRPSGISNTTAYSVPDLAVDSTGTLHAVWTSGFGGPAPIYYSTISNPTGTATESILATGTGSYSDPAKITVAPNGDVWVLYTVRTSLEEDLFALRKPAGSSTFGSPIALKNAAGVVEKSGDMEVDSQGRLHLAWVDTRAGRHVYYGLYNPSTSSFLEEVQVSTVADSYQRVSLILDAEEKPVIVFDSVGTTAQQLGVLTPPAPAAAEFWGLYQ